METVRLLNGTEEARVLVFGVMMSLENLFLEGLSGSVAFYELVKKCENPNHQIFSEEYKEILEKAALLKDGAVHSSVRNIVLSAKRGEGLGLALGNPVDNS